MNIRLILAPAFAALSIANIASAQSPGDSPLSSTEQLFERVNESVCTIVIAASDGTLVNRGSGFILREGGRLVTNAHVLVGATAAKAKCNGQLADIERITNYHPDVDLVVAEVSALDVTGLPLSNRSNINPGTQIFAFGSPYGLEGTISPGLSSGEREIDGRSYIQISAPISAGSSGGPVTDARGVVIAVTVAALDAAQGINFALPAAAIRNLPPVDFKLSELVLQSYDSQPFASYDPPSAPEFKPSNDAATFRGYPFGSPCGDIAVSEYSRKLASVPAKGDIRFNKWYAGKLEMDVRLSGAPATVIYDCSDRFGFFEGHYEITGYDQAVAEISQVLTRKYGVGFLDPIPEEDASSRGCRWNFSLPGSRFYRPTERTIWDVDRRLRIELIRCGGKSNATFVYYTDPMLVEAVQQAQRRPAGEIRAPRDADSGNLFDVL